MLYNATVYRDEAGRVVGVFAAARDITARKRAEAEVLQQSRLIDLAHDAILMCDMEGRISYWNQGAERMYGWTREEALGRGSHELLRTQFPVPLSQFEADLIRNGSWEGEMLQVVRDGAQVVVAGRWVVDRDERGEPRATLEINNDITQRKRGGGVEARAPITAV